MSNTRNATAKARIGQWGGDYLASTKESVQLAKRYGIGNDAQFASDGSDFIAYMLLFVAFNNVYAFLGDFARGQEKDLIRQAVSRLRPADVETFYTHEYREKLKELNGRLPEQLSAGPDFDDGATGVVNMASYLRGESASEFLSHVELISGVEEASKAKVETLSDTAATLLYTIRNNQFHSIKSSNHPPDRWTLTRAFDVLLPIVEALIPELEREIDEIRSGDPSSLA
jgi:hypothetical protein